MVMRAFFAAGIYARDIPDDGGAVVAVGARHVDDDSRLVVGRIGLVLDGGEGAEEDVADVGEDGGASAATRSWERSRKR
jgi:hypothetical protein